MFKTACTYLLPVSQALSTQHRELSVGKLGSQLRGVHFQYARMEVGFQLPDVGSILALSSL